MNLSEALSNIILDGGVEKGLSEIMNFTNANKYGWTYSQLMNTWKLIKKELEENGVLEVPYPNNSNKKLGIDIIDDRLEYSVKAITGLEISDFDAYGEGAQIIKAIRKLFINEWQKIAADKGLKVESVMSLSEAKQELREHGYKLLKETRRPGMHRQVFKQSNDFESFMNDNKIKGLYNFVVKEKKKNDKELIEDGCNPDEYDSIWNYMDEFSYFEKLGAAVNAFLGEDKIDVYTRPSTVIVETENNTYEFDTNSGEWDNTALGTGRQNPAEFFKTIFKIATEN